MDTILEHKTFDCRIITPMFSTGAYPSCPEIRTPEIKGLMRYTYRIACATEDNKALLQDESALFGGAANDDGGHASPIRLSVTNKNTSKISQKLLRESKIEQNPRMSCLQKGTFKIQLRFNKVLLDEFDLDLKWYTDLLMLSLFLGGLGKRSRKGRGSVAIVVPDEYTFTNTADALKKITTVLNNVASHNHTGNAGHYRLEGNAIVSDFHPNASFPRPIITRIELGSCIPQDKITAYLDAIDCACHHVKDDYLNKTDKKCIDLKNNYAKHSDNDLRDCVNMAVATGSSNFRIASPLLTSIVLINGQYYPVNTFVHAVAPNKNNNVVFDEDNTLRQKFISLVENCFTNDPLCSKKDEVKKS